MDKAIELHRLRELFLSGADLQATRWLALSISALLFICILILVRQRKLREEFTPIWLVLGFVLIIVSYRLDFLRTVTRFIGAWAPSSTIFFLGEIVLLMICIFYAVKLSSANLRIKNLTQEIAILKADVDDLRSTISGGRDR